MVTTFLPCIRHIQSALHLRKHVFNAFSFSNVSSLNVSFALFYMFLFFIFIQFNSAGCSLLSDIDRRISRATNDPRQVSYIFQQISVAIIRGNALAITASSRKYVQELVETLTVKMEMHCYVYITLISCIRNKKVSHLTHNSNIIIMVILSAISPEST